MVLESLIYCIIWLGMLAKEDLTKVTLPAILRNLVFHPANLLFKLSMMNWKFPPHRFFVKDRESQVLTKVVRRMDDQERKEIFLHI